MGRECQGSVCWASRGACCQAWFMHSQGIGATVFGERWRGAIQWNIWKPRCSRRYSTDARRGARTSLASIGCGRFTTPCSSDASAGGNGSAATTPSRTPTRLPRQSQGIEVTVRNRRILIAGFVARLGKERLPRRVMLEELVQVNGYSGEQENDWMECLEELVTGFGMKFEGWRKAAQKAGRWFRRVEEGAKAFMRKRHMQRAVELQTKTRRPRPRHPLLASICWTGEGRGVYSVCA